MLKQFIPTGLQQFSFYSRNQKFNQNLFRFSVNKKKETKYCKFRLIKKNNLNVLSTTILSIYHIYKYFCKILNWNVDVKGLLFHKIHFVDNLQTLFFLTLMIQIPSLWYANIFSSYSFSKTKKKKKQLIISCNYSITGLLNNRRLKKDRVLFQICKAHF